MPELPEVETTRLGIIPWLVGRQVVEVRVREARLRWPVPGELLRELPGQVIESVSRRGKYLLVATPAGTLILHLGMSGSLRVVPAQSAPGRHEHVDIVLQDGACLRLHDPRRFGTMLWTRDNPLAHPLLAALGPEPLGDEFSGDRLFQRSRGRRVAVKAFLMDSHVVVGIGNIYASEALFLASIDPRRAAGRVSLARYNRLASAVRQVLTEAIAQGGTTLRDFTASDGSPGYFAQYLRVYGRPGEPCVVCRRPIFQIRQGQRSSFLCRHCQH